jgi:hypothetical protein
MTKNKFIKPPVMTRRGGFKRTEHDAKWLGDVIGAVHAGTPAELKGLPVAYHGTKPHAAEDIAPGPRPSVSPTEPADVPKVEPDETRTVSAEPYPAANKGASKGPTVPDKLGGK